MDLTISFKYGFTLKLFFMFDSNVFLSDIAVNSTLNTFICMIFDDTSLLNLS